MGGCEGDMRENRGEEEIVAKGLGGGAGAHPTTAGRRRHTWENIWKRLAKIYMLCYVYGKSGNQSANQRDHGHASTDID